jgi:hypothetical protein
MLLPASRGEENLLAIVMILAARSDDFKLHVRGQSNLVSCASSKLRQLARSGQAGQKLSHRVTCHTTRYDAL